MDINPGNLMAIIQSNGKQYVIPVYQRNYEWEEEQCIKLFNDIIKTIKTDKMHFCGSVVIAPLMEKNISYYVIVDGQQRMTTLYLLLKAMMDLAEDDMTRKGLDTLLFNRDIWGQSTLDEKSRLKLKPIKSDNEQLMLLIQNKTDNINVNGDIYKNYMLFKKLVKKEIDNGLSIIEIVEAMKHLTCAKIVLNNEDNVQEIFERINSTGVPLSLADKIRNYVLMTDKNQEELYEDYWLKIEENTTDNIDTFFINLLHFKSDALIKEKDAYDIFKAIYNSENKSNKEILEEILHYSEFYNTFITGEGKYSESIKLYLKDLKQLKQTTTFLFLFSLFDDYHRGVIKEQELEDVLCLIRNYSIRHIVCERGSNSLRGLYKTLYSRVFANPSHKNNYYDAIATFLNEFLTSKDQTPTDEEFKRDLKEKDLYKKPVVCKYLLSRIENKGKEKVITSNLTIEHIMPQNKNLSVKWQKMLGANWPIIQEKYLHTLGNLTLTGYNSELGDKPFDEKKDMIENAETKMVTLYKDIQCCTEWTETEINNRAEKLANTILELFPIKSPTVKIDFKDPNYKEYDLSDPAVAEFKTPNYFIIEGVKTNANSFTEITKQLVEYLFEVDKDIIKDMARKDESLTSPKVVMFSYNKDIVGDNLIGGTNVYYRKGFSAPETIRVITALLNIYGISQNDFVYSAKER